MERARLMTPTTMLTSSEALEAQLFGAPSAEGQLKFTDAMILAMLEAGEGISDLIFSPGRPPQVEQHGELVRVPAAGVVMLDPEQTARISRELIRGNEHSLQTLRDHGACDLSYSIPNRARFRVNVFRQRGSFAIVMRVIATHIPTLSDLKLPASLADIASLKNGIVLVTGPTGSGKSSTLAAIINLINETRAEHIITIEDPIEFLYLHKKATVHQRELHSDTPTFALALRAALRQAPKVILVGEMRDRETMEIALTAAETGHLVFSTLHTIDASIRCFISQRLVPKIAGGRLAVLEVLKSTMRTRDYIERGDEEGRSLLDAMRDGELDGMQYFDGELEKLTRAGTITPATALLYATNAGNLRVQIADLVSEEVAV
jgi:twitching motility protein PilT